MLKKAQSDLTSAWKRSTTASIPLQRSLQLMGALWLMSSRFCNTCALDHIIEQPVLCHCQHRLLGQTCLRSAHIWCVLHFLILGKNFLGNCLSKKISDKLILVIYVGGVSVWGFLRFEKKNWKKSINGNKRRMKKNDIQMFIRKQIEVRMCCEDVEYAFQGWCSYHNFFLLLSCAVSAKLEPKILLERIRELTERGITSDCRSLSVECMRQDWSEVEREREKTKVWEIW